MASRVDFTDRNGGHTPQPSDLSWHATAEPAWLLLVHGYNNNPEEAADAYGGFEAVQRELFPGVADAGYAPGWHRIEVLWQGFARWGPVGFAFYPLALPNARVTGDYLAEALVDAAAGQPRRVHVLAHSLGCRVTLELVRALRQRRQEHPHAVRVERAVFFAAAVPTYALADDPPLRLRDALLHEGVEVSSLYSGSDVVLSGAFPGGQTLGREGFFPTALGHTAWSGGLQARIEQHDNAPAGHGDYWGASWTREDACARNAGRTAARFLRWNNGASRELQERSVQRRAELLRPQTAARGLPARAW